MKYLIILGDGMADEPIPRLGGRTPLQAARKPTIDRIAALGASGILDTVPEGFAPGSEIAHLSLLGYDVPSVFEGRGSLEAAGMGVSYRHLLTIRGGDKRLHTVGPHDVPDRPFAEVLPSAADAAAEPTARQLRELIFRSQELLADHPVNRARRAAGKQPATSIWPWSPGYRPRMQTLQERYAPIRNGSVISAVDLIRGIGVCAGLTPVEVEGATGLYDTNYEGKAEAALRALRDEDFVFLHIEASDEAGHEGDAELKVRTIEALDARVVRPIFEAVSAWECPVSLAILPDHPTPCLLRTHTAAPVPFTIWRSGCHPDMVGAYDEQSARRGRYGHLRGDAFIDLFIHGTE